jgi:hypothetical protein
MPPKSPSTAAVPLFLALALAGCDVKIKDGKASVGVVSAEATDEWTHHYPLAADGLVEIVNLNGSIEVTTGAAGTVDVHASIKAKTMTEAGARDILAKGKVEETAEPARIHIETMMPRGVHGSYEVRYDVTVPPGTRMEVSTTNGPLKVSGLEGKLKATAINGKVDLQEMSGGIDSVVANGALTVNLTRVTAPVRLEVTNGSLVLDLPAATQANLTARVINGQFGVSGLKVAEPTGRRIKDLEASLNGGGPELSARVTNGRLSIEGK